MIDEKLQEFMESYNNVPFRYGSADCLLFANDWVNTFIGRNLRSKYPGNYNNETEALQHLHSYGFSSTQELLNAEFKAIDINQAKRGDLVATEMPSGLAIGVLAGEIGIFKSQYKGTVGISFKKLSLAWRIK